MPRKFTQSEIDIIYDQLRPDEELLWRGKPDLIPNMAYISTLFLFFLCFLLVLIQRIVMLGGHTFSDWYFYVLLLSTLGSAGYIGHYVYHYTHLVKNIFYVVTDNRVSIFDNNAKKLTYSKRFSSIKILRLKKTIFPSASIVFDIELNDDRMKEIGFLNINHADEVMGIINGQLHHTRNSE